jgi:hypothetical protein
VIVNAFADDAAAKQQAAPANAREKFKLLLR